MSNIKFLYFVIAYLLGLVLLSIYLGKKEVETSDDFLTAGRSLSLPILIGTLLATWVGGGTVTGTANFIYSRGPIAGILHLMGPPFGILILYFIANRIRNIEGYTVPEILEIRYGSVARTISAICIILAYVGIASNQFKGCGYIISLSTGLDINIATILSAVAITLLAVSGGMYAIAYSDFASALLMVIGFLIAIPFALRQVGGFSNMTSQIPEIKTTVTGGLTWAQMLGFIFPGFFLVLGDQNMYQRFGSAKDAETARKSNIGFFVAEIIVCALTIILVTVGIVLIPNLEEADTVVFVMAMEHLPFVIGGIVIATSVAFMITTGDSFLLSASTNVTEDIWMRFTNKDVTGQEKLRFTRVTIVVLSVLAYIFGKYFPSMLKMQTYAYTMYGAAITPALLGALTWKRANKYGGLASIISGGAMTLIWDVVLKQPMDLNSSIISVPVAVIVLIVVSLLTPEPEQKTLERIFGENA